MGRFHISAAVTNSTLPRKSPQALLTINVTDENGIAPEPRQTRILVQAAAIKTHTSRLRTEIYLDYVVVKTKDLTWRGNGFCSLRLVEGNWITWSKDTHLLISVHDYHPFLESPTGERVIRNQGHVVIPYVAKVGKFPWPETRPSK
jgi:hypothetical protein